jgi:YfiH family protein
VTEISNKFVPLRWLTPDWPAPATVRALSTLRGGGVSVPPYASLNLGGHVGDDGSAVAENRRALREAAELPAEPAWLNQVHGIDVRDLDSTAPIGRASPVGPRGAGHAGLACAADAPVNTHAPVTADAAVTRQPGRVCAILTADCLPVLLASESGDRVGAAHAGWRGLAAGVIEATVAALGSPPGELLAWLGPAIGPRHFEVGSEVREEFLRAAEAPHAGVRRGGAGAAMGPADPAGSGDTHRASVEAAFVPNARGRYLADLYALARLRLARAGVHRVFGGGECTYADGARYFSHRRDGTTGRQATLIWLESAPRR